MTKFPIYLDNNATTQVDEEVVQSMLPYFSRDYGNASSAGHIIGRKASAAVELARETIAEFLRNDSSGIIFTSGTTESNNILLSSLLNYDDTKNEVIISNIEHPSVSNFVNYLKKRGLTVKYLKVDKDGVVDPEVLDELITEKTAFISVMHSNNEIGSLQNIKRISEIAAAYNVPVHSDIAQSVGKVEINFESCPADFLTFGAHKFYGPKGIGVVALKKGVKRKVLTPLLHGGGQEYGIRPGTLNVPLIVGISEATKIITRDIVSYTAQINRMTQKIFECFTQFKENVRLNGSFTNRLPGNLNFTIPGINPVDLFNKLDNICFSSGSACSSGSSVPSHVLKAIGLSDSEARSSIRIGVGKFNTMEEIDYVCSLFSESLNELLY